MYHGLNDHIIKRDAVGMMDISNVLRPEDLPWELKPWVEEDLRNLIEAYGRDDLNIDCYEMEALGSFRDLPYEAEQWCRRYYIYGGFKIGEQLPFPDVGDYDC